MATRQWAGLQGNPGWPHGQPVSNVQLHHWGHLLTSLVAYSWLPWPKHYIGCGVPLDGGLSQTTPSPSLIGHMVTWCSSVLPSSVFRSAHLLSLADLPACPAEQRHLNPLRMICSEAASDIPLISQPKLHPAENHWEKASNFPSGGALGLGHQEEDYQGLADQKTMTPSAVL